MQISRISFMSLEAQVNGTVQCECCREAGWALARSGTGSQARSSKRTDCSIACGINPSRLCYLFPASLVQNVSLVRKAAMHRRHPAAPQTSAQPDTSSPHQPADLLPLRTRPICLRLIVPLCAVYLLILTRDFPPTTCPPDHEQCVAALRLPWPPSSPPSPPPPTSPPAEQLLICMPTVTRPSGVEYISNAVKSWHLSAAPSHRLIVFDMNLTPLSRQNHTSTWLARVFTPLSTPFPDDSPTAILRVLSRAEDRVPEAVRRTHGDGEARVRWRSKEALDYAEVLERCVAAARGRYVAVVQDDVLFSAGFARLVRWLDGLEGAVGEAWCSASLFDIGGEREGKVKGAQVLRSSNMVGRVWRVDWEEGREVARIVKYLRARFDASPVDWLADEWCRKRRKRRSWAAVPSFVRHRGRVPSFRENEREGTLT